MTVKLEPITEDNRLEAEALDVAEEQRRFLETASVREFLADAPSYPMFEPHLIRAEGVAAGLVSFGFLPEERMKWWVPLLIIDRRHQRQGLWQSGHAGRDWRSAKESAGLPRRRS